MKVKVHAWVFRWFKKIIKDHYDIKVYTYRLKREKDQTLRPASAAHICNVFIQSIYYVLHSTHIGIYKIMYLMII